MKLSLTSMLTSILSAVKITFQAILCESGCNFWFHRVCTGKPRYILTFQRPIPAISFMDLVPFVENICYLMLADFQRILRSFLFFDQRYHHKHQKYNQTFFLFISLHDHITSLKLIGLAEAAFHFLTQEIYAEWVCDR